ncbi:hypothetical protein CC79DRAFT_1356928 [Sarocladium strictum]
MSVSAHVGHGILAQESQVQIAGGIHYHATVPHSSVNLSQRLLSSLRFKGMDERYYNVDEELYGTCKWLPNTPAWLAWQRSFDSDDLPRLFWIKGHPGTGKSTLMRFAYGRHAPKPDEIVLSHFFNARGSELERSINGMQRTLITQLLHKLSGYVSLDASFLEMILPHDGEWAQGRLHNLFTEILRKNRHYSFSLFVDALDECDEEQARHLIRDFSSLLLDRRDQFPKIRICLASRYYPGIVIPLYIKHYVLELEAESGHLEDIAQFIREKLIVGDQVFEEVKCGLTNKANRSFLWCDLVITELNQTFSDGLLGVEEAKLILQQVPHDLSGLFRRLLGTAALHRCYKSTTRGPQKQ